MTDTKQDSADTTVVTQDENKITWGLTRKVNLGNYESMDVSIYMTDHAPADTPVQQFLTERTEAAFDMLKTEVYTALNLDFEYDADGHPIPVSKAPTPPAAPAAQPPVQTVTVQPSVGTTQPVGNTQPVDNPTVAQVGYYPEEPTFCRDCGAQGLDQFWDNRQQNDQKIQNGQKIGPDFRCKNKACEGGNGPNKSGKPTPIYRPGSYEYNQKVGQVPPPLAPPTQGA